MYLSNSESYICRLVEVVTACGEFVSKFSVRLGTHLQLGFITLGNVSKYFKVKDIQNTGSLNRPDFKKNIYFPMFTKVWGKT